MIDQIEKSGLEQVSNSSFHEITLGTVTPVLDQSHNSKVDLDEVLLGIEPKLMVKTDVIRQTPDPPAGVEGMAEFQLQYDDTAKALDRWTNRIFYVCLAFVLGSFVYLAVFRDVVGMLMMWLMAAICRYGTSCGANINAFWWHVQPKGVPR